MTVVPKYIYIDKLNEIVDKYNKTYYGTVKLKPDDVKPGKYINYDVEHNDKDLKLKQSNIFAKECTANWSEEVFVIKK